MDQKKLDVTDAEKALLLAWQSMRTVTQAIMRYMPNTAASPNGADPNQPDADTGDDYEITTEDMLALINISQNAQSSATLAVAEQMKRIADSLEKIEAKA